MVASLVTPVSMVAAEEEAVEEIAVTGSRIRRDEFTSASPIQVIDAEDLAASSVGSLDEYLQDIPAFSLVRVPTTATTASRWSTCAGLVTSAR